MITLADEVALYFKMLLRRVEHKEAADSDQEATEMGRITLSTRTTSFFKNPQVIVGDE